MLEEPYYKDDCPILRDFYTEIKNRKTSKNDFIEYIQSNDSLFKKNFDSRINRIITINQNYESVVDNKFKELINSNSKFVSWSGPYSELVAIDVFSQSQYNSNLKLFQKITCQDSKFRNSLVEKNKGQEIDLDMSFEIKGEKMIYADVKSLIPSVLEILNEKIYALEKNYNVIIGIADYIPLPYNDIKSVLNEIKCKAISQIECAIKKGEKNINVQVREYTFNFVISYNGVLSYCPNIVFDPYREALCDADKCLDHWNKILPNDYSFIIYVTNPLFSFNRYINPFNNEGIKTYFRSFARRVFIERQYNEIKINNFKSSEISSGFSGIIFIIDKSSEVSNENELYDCFIYLNPNYKAKPPLTEYDCNYMISNSYLKDIDDFKYDNY